MASFSGGDPGGSNGRSFPAYFDPRNEFGAVTTLLLTGKDGSSLPVEPFIIGKSIEDLVGPIESAKSEAQCSRYVLRTRKVTQVEKLLKMTELYDGTEIEVKLHPTLNTSRCVIFSYDLMRKDEDVIVKELQPQGVIAARRILKSNKEPTTAVILTFNRPICPETVKVGLLRVATKPYYPNPLLCFQCFLYGHSRAKCPNTKLCPNCSNDHEERNPCEERPFCRNCKGPHRPTSRQCEIYKTEADVIRTKIDYNLSYGEARARVEAGNGSYAAVAAQPRLDHARLNALSAQMQEKQEQIAKLEEKLRSKDNVEEQLSMIIEQNRQKEEKINELLEQIRQKESRIEKLEAQVENMTKFFDDAAEQTESINSEPEPEVGRKKSKRTINHQHHQSQKQQPSRMSPPPKKATTKPRSPIMTRSASQSSIEVVETAGLVKDNDGRFRNRNRDRSPQRQ